MHEALACMYLLGTKQVDDVRLDGLSLAVDNLGLIYIPRNFHRSFSATF